MNPVTEDLKDLMVEKGLGKFAGTAPWGIFIAKEPTEPINSITLFDTTGIREVTKAYNSPNYFYPSGFQVRVRGTSYLEAKSKIDDIISALDRVGRFSSQHWNYKNVVFIGEPQPFPMVGDFFIWTVNGTAFRQIRNQQGE